MEQLNKYNRDHNQPEPFPGWFCQNLGDFCLGKDELLSLDIIEEDDTEGSEMDEGIDDRPVPENLDASMQLDCNEHFKQLLFALLKKPKVLKNETAQNLKQEAREFQEACGPHATLCAMARAHIMNLANAEYFNNESQVRSLRQKWIQSFGGFGLPRGASDRAFEIAREHAQEGTLRSKPPFTEAQIVAVQRLAPYSDPNVSLASREGISTAKLAGIKAKEVLSRVAIDPTIHYASATILLDGDIPRSIEGFVNLTATAHQFVIRMNPKSTERVAFCDLVAQSKFPGKFSEYRKSGKSNNLTPHSREKLLESLDRHSLDQVIFKVIAAQRSSDRYRTHHLRQLIVFSLDSDSGSLYTGWLTDLKAIWPQIEDCVTKIRGVEYNVDPPISLAQKRALLRNGQKYKEMKSRLKKAEEVKFRTKSSDQYVTLEDSDTEETDDSSSSDDDWTPDRIEETKVASKPKSNLRKASLKTSSEMREPSPHVDIEYYLNKLSLRDPKMAKAIQKQISSRS